MSISTRTETVLFKENDSQAMGNGVEIANNETTAYVSMSSMSVDQKGERQTLKVKDLFAKNFLKAVTDPNLREQFFCRPDCIADVWIVLVQHTHECVIYQPLINWLEASLVEILSHDDCNFEWCLRNGIVPNEGYEDVFNHTRKTMLEVRGFIENESTTSMSIKEIATSIQSRFKAYPVHSESLMDLLMYRVKMVCADDYYGQGWLEDWRSE